MTSFRQNRHRKALTTVAVAIVLDIIAGIIFAIVEHISLGLGLYWAVATATTVGYGDVIPKTFIGHVVAVLVMLTVIPLFAATFSLLTTTLTAEHVRREGAQARIRLDHIIKHHPAIPELNHHE